MFLIAKLMYEDPPEHIIIALKDSMDLQSVKDNIPFFTNISVVSESREYPLINDMTTYYVCKDHSCMPPVNTFKP